MTSANQSGKEPFRVKSVGDLWACALIIEKHAVENYQRLADQMESQNNVEVADFFREMSEVEVLHVKHIEKMTRDIVLPELDEGHIHWPDEEIPDSPSEIEGHYLMSPDQALHMAIKAEKRALKFYQQIAMADISDNVRNWAKELAEEEDEHVEMLLQWLGKYPVASNL